MSRFSPEEVLCIGPGRGVHHKSQPRVTWFAPGSISRKEVESTWLAEQSLEQLSDVPGPWGAVLESSNGETVVACDPVGLLPLYVAEMVSGGWLVGSWIDAMMSHPDVAFNLDPEGVLLEEGRDMLTPALLHRTRFSGVIQMPPGHALVIRGSGSSLVRYWNPWDLEFHDSSLSPDDSVALLQSALEGAIQRLAMATPSAGFGAHVSGGLDCTTVACIANETLREVGSHLVRGYSWAPDYRLVPRLPGDERYLLDLVEAQEGIEVARVGTADRPAWFVERDRNLYPAASQGGDIHHLAQMRFDGVDFVFTGLGGDELASFNGRGVLSQRLRHMDLPWIWRYSEARDQLLRGRRSRLTQRLGSFTRVTLHAASPRGSRIARTPVAHARDRAALRRVDQQINEFSPRLAQSREERRARLAAAITDPHLFMMVMFTGGHLQKRARGLYQTGRLFDVFYYHPLLDLEVIKAALRLPWQSFLDASGWDRPSFRRLASRFVPGAVAWNVSKGEPALSRRSLMENRKQIGQSRRAAVRGSTPYLEAMRLADLTKTYHSRDWSGERGIVIRPGNRLV